MISWYQCFILAVIALRVFAAPADRTALSIILCASLASTLLVHFVTHEITGAWKLAVPGAVEVLTIAAMMQWGSKTGVLQSFCLLIAWLDHVLCYLDITLNTNIVYDRYETILLLVAIAQILVCYQTLARIGRGAVALGGAVRVGRGYGLRPTSFCDNVLHGRAGSVLASPRGIEKTS